MSSFSIEGWCKSPGAKHSIPIEHIEFYLSGDDHLRLEQAEEHLQQSHDKEIMVEVDLATLDLHMPVGYGPLADCKLRVYLRKDDQRGQFHLVGHRFNDGSLIYSNAVLIDQLM